MYIVHTYALAFNLLLDYIMYNTEDEAIARIEFCLRRSTLLYKIYLLVRRFSNVYYGDTPPLSIHNRMRSLHNNMDYYLDQARNVRCDGHSVDTILKYVSSRKTVLSDITYRKVYRKKFYYSKANRMLSKYLEVRYPPALKNASYVWNPLQNEKVDDDIGITKLDEPYNYDNGFIYDTEFYHPEMACG